MAQQVSGPAGPAEEPTTRLQASRAVDAVDSSGSSGGNDDDAGSRARAVPFTDEERRALYADLSPLVQRLVQKYGPNAERRKELEREIFGLFCGLLEAHDPAAGVPLKAFLIDRLTAAAYNAARRRWRQEEQEGREDRSEQRQPVSPPLAPPPPPSPL